MNQTPVNIFDRLLWSPSALAGVLQGVLERQEEFGLQVRGTYRRADFGSSRARALGIATLLAMRWRAVVVVWWLLITSYVAAPCLLIGDMHFTMGLFACQDLGRFPRELPVLSLVSCLVACILLLPSSVLEASAWWHSVGLTALLASGLKILLVTHGWLEFIGIVTGRAAAVYIGLLLLAVARRSVFGDWHQVEYPKMIAFHRVVGWWVVALSLLHSVAFGAYFLEEGGWQRLWEACVPVAISCEPSEKPCWNTEGLVNGFGVIATLFVSFLGLLSRETVRRRSYNLFYVVHLASSFIFMLFCGLHDFPMAILMFPGLVLYLKDRFAGLRARSACEVQVDVLCQGESNLMLLSWSPTASGSQLAPGTRWLYVREKSISPLWHPYSMILCGSRAHVLLKGCGDWSTSFFDLASTGAPRLEMEGPYGKAQGGTLPPEHREHLLLVAGGVGISPFVDLLCGFQGHWQSVKLIWAVRGEEYCGLAAAIDLQFLSQRAEISIFITSPAVGLAPVVSQRIGPSSTSWKAHNLRTMSLMLSFTLILLGAVASDFAVHTWDLSVDVHSLTSFALLHRLVPLLLVALALLVVGLLLPGHAAKPRPQAVDERPPATVEVQQAKMDLRALLARQAGLGPLRVKACGPTRMLSAVTEATVALKGSGHQVELEKLESEL